ncbi:IS3 family transposase [Paenibacillus tyrfis]|nr:IS3 family transposase [Paenibacillus tyrfis]
MRSNFTSIDKLKREIDHHIYYYNNHRYQQGLKKMISV